MTPPHTRRAVITGLGPLTPVGIGKDLFWQGLLSGRSGIHRLSAFDPSPFHAQCTAEVSNLDPTAHLPPHRLKRLDRFSRFALIAAKLAIADGQLQLDSNHPNTRYGVSFGTALGGLTDAESQHSAFLENGPKAINKALALRVFGGASHSNIAIDFGLQGPGTTNANSCASGNVAVGDAFRFIREGLADLIVAGAADAPISPLSFAAFDNINTMSRTLLDPPCLACRPFDQRRDGFVMGEGAAALIVEELEHAKNRGAHIYAEILGFSLNNDAHHMTTPAPDGRPLVRAMSDALDQAGLTPNEIQHINAHGSATQLNDHNEARSIERVFGSRDSNRNLTVTATKAATGHSLGAAGAIEAVAACLAIARHTAPPTLHLEKPDEGINLNFVPNIPEEQHIRRAMNNSFGFGGINSCLVLGAPD
ncbi:MAG: beta-ketoacyl-[acyl-carrier-protein] synthase family protein [Verrucomicrobiota bacterium]